MMLYCIIVVWLNKETLTFKCKEFDTQMTRKKLRVKIIDFYAVLIIKKHYRIAGES